MSYLVADSRTLFSENDSVGDWDESTTSYYDGIEFGGRSGSGFVGYDVDIETLHNFEIAIVIPSDVTGVHYGQWIRITNSGALDTKLNGGIRLCLRDGAGNESYFFVGGIDTYGGGWYYFVADMSGTPDANNGTNASITDAVAFGVGGKFLAKSPDDNFQMDLGHYGVDGLTITGTPDTATYGVGKSIEEIYSIINTNNLGGISKQAGSYVARLPITIDTEIFDDTDSIIFFENFPVSDTFYKIKLGTITVNNIAFSGLINKTEGITACELDFSASVNSFSYDDSTSLTQGLTTFKSGLYSGNKFVGCAGIEALDGANLSSFSIQNTGLINLNANATLSNSEVYKSTGTEAVKCINLSNATNNLFTSLGTGYAIDVVPEITSNVSMSWENIVSGYVVGVSGDNVGVSPTGNEAILVNVASGVILTINIGAGKTIPSVANIGLGTINIVSGQVTLTLTGLPVGIEVRIRQGSFTIEHWQDVLSGQISYSYTYSSDKKVTISFSGAGITESFTLPFVLGSQDQTSLITFNNDPSFQS